MGGLGGGCACKGGGGGGGCERRSAATDFQSMDSLSLSTSGEDFAPLWQTRKDSLWTLEATGAKNTKSTCSTTVSCFAIMIQIVWIFFYLSNKEYVFFCPVLFTVRTYTQQRIPQCMIRLTTHSCFSGVTKVDSDCYILIPHVAFFVQHNPQIPAHVPLNQAINLSKQKNPQINDKEYQHFKCCIDVLSLIQYQLVAAVSLPLHVTKPEELF